MLITINGIGKKIKQLRIRKSLSLDALAKKTALSKSFLSEMERGKKFPRLNTLQRIVQELGARTFFLFKE